MFKVMTWNVENLFRFGEAGGPTSQEVYDAKLTGLAATINAQAPDVLSLQEVGSPGALDDLVGKLEGDWNRQLSTHPDGRHIRVVWLSRAPIQDVEDIRDFPDDLQPVQSDDDGGTVGAMGRGALAITVELGGESVRLVTAHLKSKLLEFPGGRFSPHDEDERSRFGAYALYRRAAEASTLRSAVTAALAGEGQTRALVLTGDLNDTVQAATTQILLGPPGSEIGTHGFDLPDKGDAQRLWNLAPLMPPGQDYSRVNAGRKELIDHVLASAALVRRVGSVGAIIDQPLPSVGANPNERRNAPSSDHAPVVATFD
jgi:endonuclease/exonuclease/phosphatase family metal-dependent hydrolase